MNHPLSDTPPDSSPLPSHTIEITLKRIIREGIASQIMESLTAGVFLVGLALYYNASNFVIGLLGAIPFLSNLFQVPAIFLVNRYGDRRKIVANLCFIGRSFLLIIALTPFISDKETSLRVLLIAVAIRYSIGSMSTCAWNSWMRDLVPVSELSRFFGKRLFYVTAVATLFSVGAAFFIDWWARHFSAHTIFSYTFLYVVGFAMAMLSSYLVLAIPHPPIAKAEMQDYHLNLDISHLLEPFHHENFRKLMLFLTSWGFAINLAAPFFTVYMIKTLGYTMTFVIIMTLVSQVANVLTLRLWGKYADLYSNKTVLRLCGALFIFCILGWTFVTFPGKHTLTVPLLVVLHILMGISTAGVTLSSGNIALKLAPKASATSFLAMNSILSSLAAGIAPLFGGIFADFFEDKNFSILMRWHDKTRDIHIYALEISNWDFFFLLAFIIGLYSLRRLALLKEEGEVHEQIVIREMIQNTGRILRSFSSVAGLRMVTSSSLVLMVNRLKKKR